MAALLILRIGEILLALLAVVMVVFLVGHDADVLRIWGLWGNIADLESAVFIAWLFCFLELELDARIYKHEGELIPAALMRLFILSFLVLFIAWAASALGNYAHIHLMDYTILDDGALFFVDVTGVSVTICLFLAQQRLNRAAHIS